MDETPVWRDMVCATTMKSTSHEKSRDLVCLAAKADGTKLKPTIVLKGTVREGKVLCQEFRTQAVKSSSPNRWMNIKLTFQWVKDVIGAFSFKRRFSAWNSYKCHIEGTVKKLLATKKIDNAIVAGGRTKYVQAPDISWNKTFKANCTQKNMMIGWLQEESIIKQKHAI